MGPARRIHRRRRRYRIELPLRYQVSAGSHKGVQGFGKTCNISSEGVLFKSDQALEVGESIKLSVEWPALLNGVHRLILVLQGTISRAHRGLIAMKFVRTEFRLRGRQ